MSIYVNGKKTDSMFIGSVPYASMSDNPSGGVDVIIGDATATLAKQADLTNLNAPVDITSQIKKVSTYVEDNAWQVHAVRSGKVVNFHVEGNIKSAPSDGTSFITGLPQPAANAAMQFTGMMLDGNWNWVPVNIVIKANGDLAKWYAGNLLAGRTFRFGYTYICK